MCYEKYTAHGLGVRRLRKAQAGKARIFMILIITFMAAGCASTESALSVAETPPSNIQAKHLLFIGLDGWGGAYVPKADMPTVKRMMAAGASSLRVMCVKPSNSMPNWTALFSGAPPEHQDSNQFPTIFTLVSGSDNTKKPVLFYEWSGLENISASKFVERRKILSDRESAQLIADYIAEEKPFFTAVVFNQPDSVGHGKRWGSQAYNAKLTELDSFIELIEQAAKNSNIYDSTVFVLSADHGGVLWGHGFNSSKQRRIPLVIYGSSIKEGYTIPSKHSICDIAPTMAAILGLEIPSEWTGRPIQGVFK